MSLILHVTEAFGTGVVHCISHLAKAQVSCGFDVVLVHSIRPETPPVDELDELFPSPIKRIHMQMETAVSPLSDAYNLYALAKLFNELRPDVIHLHSSKAGILGRVAATLSGNGTRSFYSPQGFAFLRQDVSPVKRWLYLLFERIAAQLHGTLIASSGTEAQLARERVGHSSVILVENCAELSHVIETAGNVTSRIRVVTSGRLTYQKAPWRFRELAVALKDLPVDFLWIGSGELEQKLRLPEQHSSVSLKSTGWLPQTKVMQHLSQADIFVMTSLWEGMPLSLVEAQAAGLPAVVPNIVGCRDVVVHGETGFICESDKEIEQYLRALIANHEMRQAMGRSARNMAKTRFSVERMHQETVRAYKISPT